MVELGLAGVTWSKDLKGARIKLIHEDYQRAGWCREKKVDPRMLDEV